MGWAPSWFNVSGGAAGAGTTVTTVARYPQHIDAFVVGTDQGIYSTWWDITTGWASWFQVAGGRAAPGSSVTVLARYPSHLDLFVVGTDQGIYSIWWDAATGWAPNWFQVAGGAAAPGTTVTAVARNPDHIDLFAVGTDHRIYSIWWDASSGWASNWFNVSGGVAAPNTTVNVVSRYPNHLDLFAVGGDQGIYSTWWDASTGWGNWFQVAGGVAAPGTSVTAVARYPDILDVFAVGTDRRIYSIWWLNEILFDMQGQQQTNWCWAATSTSVAQFYNPNSGWTQCLVANGELGRSDCCGAGASGPCNVPWFLDTALTRVGRLDHWTGSVATVAEIENEVTFARPLCLRVAWSGGGAHFLAIRGHYIVGGTDFVSVDDPIYGKSDVSYAVLQSSYQGTGSWTHTYYTRY
jgi:hypothetical protein